MTGRAAVVLFCFVARRAREETAGGAGVIRRARESEGRAREQSARLYFGEVFVCATSIRQSACARLFVPTPPCCAIDALPQWGRERSRWNEGLSQRPPPLSWIDPRRNTHRRKHAPIDVDALAHRHPEYRQPQEWEESQKRARIADRGLGAKTLLSFRSYTTRKGRQHRFSGRRPSLLKVRWRASDLGVESRSCAVV
jgi:hypothetical protein